MDEEKATQIIQNKKKKEKNCKLLHCLISSDTTFLMPLGLSLLDDLLSICSFMCSHPLPLAYVLFFSTHISTLLSFLLPLLLTTLLSLATFPHLGHQPPDHLGSTCRVLVAATLLPRQQLERDPDLVAALGFLSPIFLDLETTCVDHSAKKACNLYRSTPQAREEAKESSGEQTPPPTAKGAVPISGMLRWQEFEAIGKLYINALTHEIMGSEYPLKLALIKNLKRKQLSSSGGVGPLQVAEEGGGKESTPPAVSSEFYDPTSVTRGGGQPAWVDAKGPSGLERFGSVKKDSREWRRTLACKLYEERWVKGGEVVEVDEEGMDVLWEEEHEEKNARKPDEDGERSRRKNRMVAMAKSNTSRRKSNDVVQQQQVPTEEKKKKAEEEEEEEGEGSYDIDDGEEEEEEEEEEDGDEVVGPLCCLQALRFSTKRVMRLGMGKMKMKNLRKVSKAIKGGVDLVRSTSSRRSLTGER